MNPGKIPTRIVRRQPLTVPLEIPGLHPVLKRIYAHRGVKLRSEVEYTTAHLLPYHTLSGIQSAVVLLSQAIQTQHRILIIGDFDADGATSTAVAVKSLRGMGATQVDFLVPNRFKHGYGLTPEIVECAAASYHPDLIITVDNGISSIAGVQTAHKFGIRVCITDHHVPGPELPPADAMVNPNLPNDSFPSKNLAGVGVIFYVMLALRAYLKEQGWFQQQDISIPNLAELLDLVALGTVADVVPLDSNNRILVEQGLRRIRGGVACPGIIALLEIAGRSAQSVSASDLGFLVAPRLNAAGRLEDMSLGIACLLAEQKEEALSLALELNQINHERREIEWQMQEDAIQRLENHEMPLGLVLFQENWHPGVIGILAGRVKDEWHRPVIVFAPGTGNELKGSARSISGIHIRDVLQEIATHHPHLILKFGGHAMAAGLTIERAHLRAFCTQFNEVVSRVFPEEARDRQILTDGELTPEELSLEVAALLRNTGPWGQGFPEPLFDGLFQVIHPRIVGEKHLKLTVSPLNNTHPMDAICFHYDFIERDFSRPIQLAYHLNLNEYQGIERLQLLIEKFG